MRRVGRRGQQARVAAFLLLGLGVLVLLLALLSHSHGFFARRAMLHASFDNVGGLIVGSPVRLAGVDVGRVSGIHFDRDPRVKRVDVELSLVMRSMPRVRADSVARMASNGLLGDMVIDISIGDEREPGLADGDNIATAEAPSVNRALTDAEGAMQGVRSLVSDVDARVRDLLTPQLASDLRRITHSTADLMEGVGKGPGLAHRILFDPALADDAAHTLASGRRTAAQLERGVADVNELVARLREGDGLLHGLVYGEGGTQAASDLQRTASDLASVADAVRTGPGLAHEVVYAHDREALLADLSETARILRHLAEQTEQGKGTLGGLLQDPTAYQRLTTLLGDLQRNELLKAVIRLTIGKDGLERPAPGQPAYGGSGAPPPP